MNIGMFSITELIVFSVALVVISVLAINNVRLFVSRRKLSNHLLQAVLDKVAVEDAYSKLSQEYDTLSLQETDGFVKFLSESRAWAFTYIEDVQKSILDLSVAMESGLDAEIAKAYAQLQSHLPKDVHNN
jgi:hypothetical protein